MKILKSIRDISKSVNISDSFAMFDAVFWFGDLNYRVNGTRNMVDSLLNRKYEGCLEIMLMNDQLSREMKENQILKEFKEPPIQFLPTYKFNRRKTCSCVKFMKCFRKSSRKVHVDFEENIYDTSKKQRIPSWTDRILFSAINLVVTPVIYGSVMEPQESDHKPVFGVFTLKFPGAK
ncbi:inositol polyphosphate 5-phosphatase [Entophlyctis luteolus]|nr:inositol polyphosphate 5-phosphatase [Entophlyctis luteolus]